MMFFNEFNYRESSLLCIISPSSKKQNKKKRKSQRPLIDTKTKTPRPLTERSPQLWDNCVGSFKKHHEAPWGAQSVSQSGGSVLLCKLFFFGVNRPLFSNESRAVLVSRARLARTMHHAWFDCDCLKQRHEYPLLSFSTCPFLICPSLWRK